MVNFSPSEEQELLRQTLADFAREALRPHLRESDEKNVTPPELPAKAWELGLVQESIPEAHGGFGGTRSAVSGTLVLEELAYGGLALALHLVSPRLVTVPLLVAGTEAQRAQWLPKFTGAEFADPGGTVLPPQIILFLENLWDVAEGDEKVFCEEVRTTFLHELGHFFGLGEDDLIERGLE